MNIRFSRLSSLRLRNNAELADKRIKKSFYHFWFEESLTYLRPTLLATTVLVLLFYPLDPLVMEASAAQNLQNSRLLIMTPLLGLFFFLSFTTIHPLVYFFGLSVTYLIGGALFSLGITTQGGGLSLYGLIALIHALVFLFIPSRIPAPFCILVGILLIGIDITAVYDGNFGTDSERLLYSAGLISLTLILCMSAINRDLNAYRNYHSLKKANQFTFDQGLWAAMIARVLKHELGNHLTGITSSIEMIQLIDNRNSDKQTLSGAINRNLATVNALRQLLNRVSNYANIEIQQEQPRQYHFKLSSALQTAATQFESRHHDALVINTLPHTTDDIDIKGDNIILTLVIVSLLEYCYASFGQAKHEKTKVTLFATHHGAVLRAELNSGKSNAIATEQESSSSEYFAITVSKFILKLHSAEIIRETHTNTSVEIEIRF